MGCRWEIRVNNNGLTPLTGATGYGKGPQEDAIQDHGHVLPVVGELKQNLSAISLEIYFILVCTLLHGLYSCFSLTFSAKPWFYVQALKDRADKRASKVAR